MGTRERMAGRFQVESLEGRWAPGGLAGGVVAGGGTVAGEISRVQVAPIGAMHIGVEIPQGDSATTVSSFGKATPILF